MEKSPEGGDVGESDLCNGGFFDIKQMVNKYVEFSVD